MGLVPGEHQLEVVEKFNGLPGNIVGDSMGVGKTLECVILDLAERATRPDKRKRYRTLIICQKSGLSVWKWHLEDQGVDPARILVIDPSDRAPFDSELERGCPGYDYYLMHWDALIRLDWIVKHPKGKPVFWWDHVIADECHLGKNRNAKRTVVWKHIKTRKKTGASGTPADDKPQDFWSVLNWLDSRTYSSYWRFYDTYLDWSTHPRNGYRVVHGVKNIDQFHREVAPFYIRRTLQDVRGDMPPKTYGKINVELTTRQRRDYDAMHKFQVARIGEANEELLVTYKIAMYVRLQQMIAGTTSLDWTKFENAFEKYGHLPEFNVRRLGELGRTGMQPKNMPTGPEVIINEPSPKIDTVMEMVDTAVDSGESIVVFSQFRGVIDLIEGRCKKSKYPVSKLTGAMLNQKTRDASVADFQSRKTRVFCGTIGAAGTTITLTAANTLVFTDRHWNPSKNRQAEDRIWRINQDNACRIWDVIANDTIDDERLRRIWEKARWVDEVVNIPTHLKGLV